MSTNRTQRVAVHMTQTEKNQLQSLAQMAGYRSLARYMRETALRLATVGICATCNQPGSLKIVIDAVDQSHD